MKDTLINIPLLLIKGNPIFKPYLDQQFGHMDAFGLTNRLG